MNKKSITRKGNILVFIQFACLFYFGIFCTLLVKNPVFLLLELIGFFMAGWSIWVMRKSKLSVHPAVSPGAVLITKLPYSIIRHPMYLSVLLVSIALVLETGGFLNYVVFGILLIDLLIKIEFEERILKSSFTDYSNLCKHSKKLIPWVY